MTGWFIACSKAPSTPRSEFFVGYFCPLAYLTLSRIKGFLDAQNVRVFFPAEAEEQSSVLLVYDPSTPNASPNPVEKAKNLDEVEKELLKIAKDVADVKAEHVAVEQKWHDSIVGQNGTTLNA